MENWSENGKSLGSKYLHQRLCLKKPLWTITLFHMIEQTCLTEAECERHVELMGFKHYYVGNYQTKGCFSEKGVAFWGTGGTFNRKAKPNLSGLKKRIWCDGQMIESELQHEKKLEPTLYPTFYPTLSPTKSPNDDWDSNGHNVCMTRYECNEQREKMGFRNIYITYS